MHILILNWRDPDNPKAGGAEQATYEIFSRIAAKGHKITWFTSMFPGAPATEDKNGIKIIRQGGETTVHFHAWRWYKSQIKAGAKYDVVVDEINTIPFFTPLYVKTSRVAYIHQLAKEVWSYEAIFPISLVGRILEPVFLKPYKKEEVVTVSESTRNDLSDLGFQADYIHIVRNSQAIEPVKDVESLVKERELTLLYVGALRPMKRVEEVIKVAHYVKKKIPDVRLWIAGEGKLRYKKQLAKLVEKLEMQDSVDFFGRITEDKKTDSMRRAHFVLVTSVREGWGIVVIEANACGMPAAVYNVPGLRDSVIDGETGIISLDANPQELAARIIETANQPEVYKAMRKNAYERSKLFDWNRSAEVFLKVIEERVKQ